MSHWNDASDQEEPFSRSDEDRYEVIAVRCIECRNVASFQQAQDWVTCWICNVDLCPDCAVLSGDDYFCSDHVPAEEPEQPRDSSGATDEELMVLLEMVTKERKVA